MVKVKFYHYYWFQFIIAYLFFSKKCYQFHVFSYFKKTLVFNRIKANLQFSCNNYFNSLLICFSVFNKYNQLLVFGLCVNEAYQI